MTPSIKLTLLVLVAVGTGVFGSTFWRTSPLRPGEQAAATSLARQLVMTGSATSSPAESLAPGGISESTAIGIALRVAATKGDPDPQLVRVTATTFAEALAEVSPGAEIFGYDPGEPVYIVCFKGGPFDHVRSIPANRDSSEFITNGLFVVIRASDGDVLGTGGLRY